MRSNPYYALTDEAGRFEIKDIPPGRYKIVVWHPQEKSIIEQEVVIPGKGAISANFEIRPREGCVLEWIWWRIRISV